MSRILSRRPARRLLVALVTLAAIDPFVPGLVDRLERARYESPRTFRFENSDLFSLGPLVQYLRAHPRGDRPRVLFFGNSIVWGYFLEPNDSLPAQFQRLTGARVFNLGINGFETGSAYVVTKQIVDAVDTIYLFHYGAGAHPMLPKLVRVEPRDLERFTLPSPDPVEGRLEHLVGLWWRLYRDAYRLQAALFGTSTRQYVYRHKGSIPGAIWRVVSGRAVDGEGPPVPEPAVPADVVAVHTDVAPAPVTEARRRELAAAHPLLWDYAELIRAHDKHAIVVEIDRSSSPVLDVAPSVLPSARADLNRVFQPHVSFVTVAIPPALMIDRRHLSAAGARAVARALRDHAPPSGTGR